MVVKNGELLAVLEDDVLMTAELHCDEIAVVWYSILAEKPVRLTHKWMLIDQAQKVQKFRCSKCKATKIIVTLNSRYPIVRYQVDGVITEGKAPPCKSCK